MKYKTINQATQDNNIEAVKILLNNKINKGDFRFALNYSCKKGLLDITKILFEKNQTDSIFPLKSLNDCFWLALTHRRKDIIKYIIDNNLVVKNSKHIHYLSESCKLGCIDIVKLIIDYPSIYSEFEIESGFIQAAKKGRINVIQYLLENYNFELRSIKLAIIESIKSNKIRTFKYLMELYSFEPDFIHSLFMQSVKSSDKILTLILKTENINITEDDILNLIPDIPVGYQGKYIKEVNYIIDNLSQNIKNKKIFNSINLKRIEPLIIESTYTKLVNLYMSEKIATF